MARILQNTLSAALLSGAIAMGADAPVPVPGAVSLLKQIDQGFVQIFEKVAPSVVVIEAVKTDDDDESADVRRFDFFLRDRDGGDAEKDGVKEKFGRPHERRSEGSGFIIRPDGFILTNVHVVADADKLEVRLKDGRRFPAKVVGADEHTDIAVIKIDAKDLAAADFGDSDALKIGQLVCAIGAPFNQYYSFTCGWVSGKGRTNLLGPTSNPVLYEDYIQTDAFINPGNSGGPLFDVDGRIVGMNTLINGLARGLAFAIPSAMLAEVSKQLIADGKVRHSWIGVSLLTLADHPALREHFQVIDSGVVVDTIDADGPALKSDLRASDVITQVDGVAVSIAKELQREIAKKKIGAVVQLSVWRAGRTMQIAVTTDEVPAKSTRTSATHGGKTPAPNAETLGMKLKATDGRAVVAEVAPDGPAAKAGLRVEDVITDVESKSVGGPGAVFAAIAAGGGKDGFRVPGESAGKSRKKGVLLNVERKGERTFVVLEPGG